MLQLHRRRAAAVLVPLMLLLSAAGGCASSATSISAWQQSVTTYVRDKGGGDPAVLSTVKLPVDGRPGYAVIGHHDVEQSTDAKALLLGNEALGGRVWMVYIVGLVKQQKVTDIQLAAMTTVDGKLSWKRGKSNGDALQAYREYGIRQARERFPERTTPPPRYTQFPKPDDVFQLTKNEQDDKFVATHVATGAQWEVTVPAGKK